MVPFGPESPRMREQLWILPGADAKTPLRATLFRPADDDGTLKRPLVVINHARTRIPGSRFRCRSTIAFGVGS